MNDQSEEDSERLENPSSNPEPSSAIEISREKMDWLSDQLPKWVERGVLTEQKADDIQSLYRVPEQKGWAGIILTTLSVFGAFLIGGGILLIVAHNWDMLPKVVKLFCSFVPVLVGLKLCWWVMENRSASAAWREGSAVFLACAIAANISLIGQIYHLSSGLDRYVLTVSLLIVPLIYLMQSHLASVLFLSGITSWFLITVGQEEYGTSLAIWGLLALYVPWGYQTMRGKINTGLQVIQLGTLALAFGSIVFGAMVPGLGELWGFVGLAQSVIFLFLGKHWIQTERDRKNPLIFLGYTGLILYSYSLSFFSRVNWRFRFDGSEILSDQGIGAIDDIVLYPFLALTLIVLLVGTFRRDNRLDQVVVIAPVVYLLGVLFFYVTGSAYPPVLLFNVYILALGGAMLYQGYRTKSMKLATFGTGVMASLLALRFLDIHLPFLMRGIAFIIVGVLFLRVTRWLGNIIDAEPAASGTGDGSNE